MLRYVILQNFNKVWKEKFRNLEMRSCSLDTHAFKCAEGGVKNLKNDRLAMVRG
jgi:hypothetical protein